MFHADTFQPSATFTGPRHGWVFTRGPNGVGYYKDTHVPSAQPAAAAPVPSSTGAAAAAAPERPAAAASGDAVVPAPKPPAAAATAAAAAPQRPTAPVPTEATSLRPAALAARQREAAAAAHAALPDVPAPQPKLDKEAPELANMESDFLASLHEVRRMAADMDRIMADLGRGGSGGAAAAGGVLGAASRAKYGLVSRAVEQLAQVSAELKADHQAAQQVC